MWWVKCQHPFPVHLYLNHCGWEGIYYSVWVVMEITCLFTFILKLNNFLCIGYLEKTVMLPWYLWVISTFSLISISWMKMIYAFHMSTLCLVYTNSYICEWKYEILIENFIHIQIISVWPYFHWKIMSNNEYISIAPSCVYHTESVFSPESFLLV